MDNSDIVLHEIVQIYIPLQAQITMMKLIYKLRSIIRANVCICIVYHLLISKQ